LTQAGLDRVAHGRSPEWGETALSEPLCTDEPRFIRLSHDGVLVAVALLDPGVDGCARIILKRVFA
jgi:tRNA pseudouridine55 synthase